MTTPRPLRPLLVLVAAALFLAACGEGSSDDPAVAPTQTEDGSAGSDATEPNQADVEFTQSMIVHHRQAIQMAALAEGRAEAGEVRALATRIGETQQPEIDRMLEWLEAWGEEAPDAGGDMDHDGMDMGGGADSMGMMSQEDMEQLEATSGAEFDRMFLEMMIEHHRGAIAMAQEVQTEGSHPDVLALAEDVVSDQEAEVEEMEQLLADLGSGAQ